MLACKKCSSVVIYVVTFVFSDSIQECNRNNDNVM